jgi:hypothetical protein
VTLKEWLTHRQDERQRFYWARSGALSFSVTGIVGCLIGAAYFLQGRPVEGLIVILPWLVGSIVNTGLLFYWRVLNPR